MFKSTHERERRGEKEGGRAKRLAILVMPTFEQHTSSDASAKKHRFEKSW